MRILFLGSGGFGLPTLEWLARSQGSDLEVATVPDAPRGRGGDPAPTPVKEIARALDVPCHEVATLKKPHGLELLRATGAGIVITADIRLFLTRSFLAGPERGCFNLHGSLLPRHRGAAPVARGILAGDTEFGVTLYRMVPEMDAGPVAAARRYTPVRKEDAVTIEAQLAELAAELLAEELERLLFGEVSLTEQDHARATLAPKLTKAEGWVDWRAPADSIENHVLALGPWPRSFTEWTPARGGDPVRIFLDSVLPAEPNVARREEPLAPGTVRSVDGGLRVACGPDGTDTLLLITLQRAGKRSLPAEEFLRGCPLRPGDRLSAREAVR